MFGCFYYLLKIQINQIFKSNNLTKITIELELKNKILY